MGPDDIILVFWMLSFTPTFSLSSFTFIKRLFSSSLLSAIRVVSSAYLRLLIFLPAILIPAVLHPVQHFSWCTLLLLSHFSRVWLSPPGCPVPGILKARTVEWVAISFSNVWKWKVKVKLLSHVQLVGTPWTAAYQAPPSMGFSKQEYWSGVPLPSADALCI